jgi:hypothetical protein
LYVVHDVSSLATREIGVALFGYVLCRDCQLSCMYGIGDLVMAALVNWIDCAG